MTQINPIELFLKWYNRELSLTNVRLPGACCLSTIGIDGVPNARFVSLKDVIDGKFAITGSINSRKGLEIEANPNVALTFWWTETERQVHIQGNASVMENSLADKYFAERNRESQIVSIVSKQGQELQNVDELTQKYIELDTQSSGKDLKRPDYWRGYLIEPFRIEFLDFKSTRFHERVLYEMEHGEWNHQQLQP
tara:strand:+ start:16632 stop:17216 length:585 start_codon:yes stop_codon:yes gene_type:complete